MIERNPSEHTSTPGTPGPPGTPGHPPVSLFSIGEGHGGWQRLLPYALLLSVTFGLYAAALYFDFVWDDATYIGKNYLVQGLSALRLRLIWSTSFLGHYAPVHNSFLALLHFFSGMEPFGYHAGQLLVHAACVCLLYFVLKKLEAPRVALAASLLFAVHPTNVETVAWISETKSTLAFLFFLLSFWFFLRLRERERWGDGVLCGGFLIVSLLAKINTVVAPAIFLLYDYWTREEGRGKREVKFRIPNSEFRTKPATAPLRSRLGWKSLPKGVWSLGVFFLISAVFSAVHLRAFHGSRPLLESAYLGGPGVHLMNLPLLVGFYIRMIVFPHPLSAWEMFAAQTEFNWLIGLGWGGLLASAALLYRSSRSVQFWALWIFIFLLPVLQIIPFPIWVADRYLYIPAIGGFVLLSRWFFEAWDRLAPGWRRWAWEGALVAVLVVLGWRTHAHLPVWKDDLTLWEATTATCETSDYCHLNLGLALLQRHQTERGVKELIRSVEIRPTPLNLEKLGDAFNLSDYRQAIIAYSEAIQQAGSYATAELYGKLARVLIRSGNLDGAARALALGKKIDAYDPTVLVMEGFLEWKRGNREEARQALRKALAATGRTSNVAGFLYPFWGRAAEVGQLLSDLRAR